MSFFFPFITPLLIKPDREQIDTGVLRCQGKKAENIPKEEVLIGLLFYSSDHREVVAMWPIAKNLRSGSAINNYRTVGRI